MQTKTIIKNIEIEPKKLKIQLDLIYGEEYGIEQVKHGVNIVGNRYSVFTAEAYGFISDSLSSPEDAIENLAKHFRNITFALENISGKKHEEMEDIAELYKKIK